MSHFAEISQDHKVLRVLVVPDTQEHRGEAFLAQDLNLGGKWIRCSYNGTIRKQFPGIGWSYDPVADVFIAPPPFPSWSLDENHDWQPPTPMPSDGTRYSWDEAAQTWSERE